MKSLEANLYIYIYINIYIIYILYILYILYIYYIYINKFYFVFKQLHIKKLKLT